MSNNGNGRFNQRKNDDSEQWIKGSHNTQQSLTQSGYENSVEFNLT